MKYSPFPNECMGVGGDTHKWIVIKEISFKKEIIRYIQGSAMYKMLRPNRELHREEITLASFAVAGIMSPSWHKEKSLRVLEV